MKPKSHLESFGRPLELFGGDLRQRAAAKRPAERSHRVERVERVGVGQTESSPKESVNTLVAACLASKSIVDFTDKRATDRKWLIRPQSDAIRSIN